MSTTALPTQCAVARLRHSAPAVAAGTAGFLGARAFYGTVPRIDGTRVIEVAERAGLAGQGGAGFPVHRKMAAVREAAGANRAPGGGRRQRLRRRTGQRQRQGPAVAHARIWCWTVSSWPPPPSALSRAFPGRRSRQRSGTGG